jgi:exonuclease III
VHGRLRQGWTRESLGCMSLNINQRFYDKENSFLAFLEDEDIDIAFVQEVGIDHFDLRRFYVNGYDTFVGRGTQPG